MERTNSRINIPPLSVAKDEVTIAGEKEGVMIAECEIQRIFESKVSNFVLFVINKWLDKLCLSDTAWHLPDLLKVLWSLNYTVSTKKRPLSMFKDLQN